METHLHASLTVKNFLGLYPRPSLKMEGKGEQKGREGKGSVEIWTAASLNPPPHLGVAAVELQYKNCQA